MKKNELNDRIEEKREELVRVASSSGLSSTIAIQCSQELDRLLNAYHANYIKK